jgi:tripartite-type tricarboxylate transporter receptor subunit TctC
MSLAGYRIVRHCLGGVAGLAAAGLLAGCGVGAGSEESGSFYAGKNVDLVVPYDPGGGFDVYARGLAPFLGDCLEAEVVVRNEPGAGGLLATNATAVAQPDEPRLQIMNMPGFAAAQIAEAEGVQYDLSKFAYAGRVTTATPSLVVSTNSPLKTFDDVRESTTDVKFVATGPGSEGYIAAVVLAEAYGFPADIITGFGGSDEARTAVVAGNADVEALTYDSQLGAIASGDVRSILLVDDRSNDLLPDVPPIAEYQAANAPAQEMLDSLVALGQLGRAIAAPPGLSQAQQTELRKAFDCAMSNTELLAQFEKQQRPVVVASGAEVADQLEAVLNTSSAFQNTVKQAF